MLKTQLTLANLPGSVKVMACFAPPNRTPVQQVVHTNKRPKSVYILNKPPVVSPIAKTYGRTDDKHHSRGKYTTISHRRGDDHKIISCNFGAT